MTVLTKKKMELAWTCTLKIDDGVTKQSLQWTLHGERGHLGTLGKWIWTRKDGWRASDTAGER